MANDKNAKPKDVTPRQTPDAKGNGQNSQQPTQQDDKTEQLSPRDAKTALLMQKLKPKQPEAKDNKNEIPELIEFPDGAVTLKMPKRMKWYLWTRFPLLHPYITAIVIFSAVTVGMFTWLIMNPPESVLKHMEALKNKKKGPPMATLAPAIPQTLKKEIDSKQQQQPKLTYRQYIALGRKYHTAGNHDYALEAYRSAILLNPTADAYNAAAAEAIEIKAVTQAEQYLKAAIVLNPQYALARYNLGILYASTGNDNAAATQYQALSQMDQTLANALKKTILKQQQPQEEQ